MRITADIIDQDVFTDADGRFEDFETRHHFVTQTFTITKDTFCDYCKHLLHGTKLQGLKCYACNVNIHTKCELYYDKPCTPREERGWIQLRVEVIFKKLVCAVRQAKNLISIHSNGRSHPCVKLKLIAENGSSQEKETETLKFCHNPQWMETIAFTRVQIQRYINHRLLVEVWLWDEVSQKNFMGSLSFAISDIKERPIDSWFNILTGEKGEPCNSTVSPEVPAAVEPQSENKTTSYKLSQKAIEQLEADLEKYFETSDGETKYPKPRPGVIRKKVQKESAIQQVIELEVNKPCLGLNFVTEIQGFEGVQYYCFMCNSLCSSCHIMSHLFGYKHQLNSIKQFKPDVYADLISEPKYKIEVKIFDILCGIQMKEGMGLVAVEIEEIIIPNGDMPCISSEQITNRDHPDIPSTSREHPDIPNISRDHPDIPSTSSDHRDIQNISRDHPDIPSTSSDHQDIPNISRDHPDIPNTSSDHQDIPNISRDHPDIPNISRDHRDIPNTSKSYANGAISPAIDFSFCSSQNERFVDMCSKFRNLNISEESDGLIKTCKEFTEHIDLALNRNKTMEEPKVGCSKGKTEGETLSPGMMEFLSKMKQEIKEEIIEELTHLPRIEMQGQVLPSGKMDYNQYQGEVIHSGIFCDNCDQLIHGIRYKCGNCADFDLCQECESLPNIHNKSHIFLKIRFPVSLKLFQKQKWQPFILPNGGELLASNSKSHSSKKLYEAKFVCDETVPDGTVLSPSTRFIKSWRVLNSGKRVWTHSTKLQHIQGSVGLTPACEQVDVPHLRPGEEGIVSVLFTTPAVSGVYRSHWNFCHKSRPFGHIVWCHIVVKDPESDGKQAEIAPAGFNLTVNGMPSEKEEEVASIAKVLTAVREEHEKGNMIPRKLAVNSHTTTPNNTPFDLTPPKSPDHQAMNELKVVMEDKESLSTLSVVEYDVDDEGGSVVSLSSSDSDAEFVVIPMPNCFNLSESFASRSVSHLSVYMQSDNEKDPKASGQKSTKPNKPVFKAETVSQETGVPELSERRPSQSEEKNLPQNIHISHIACNDGSSSEISIIESGENSPTGENPMPEISSIHIAVNNGTEPKSSDNSAPEARRNSQSHDGPEREDRTSDIPATSATFPKFPVEGITSIYESASHSSPEVERTVQVLPEKIVTVPLSVASTVYNATMQVMTNLRRQYSDAQSNQEGASGTSSNTFSKVDQLVEMGFSNRNQNEELLKKHKNDIALVVAELVNMNDNDWYNSRHVPSAPSHN